MFASLSFKKVSKPLKIGNFINLILKASKSNGKTEVRRVPNLYPKSRSNFRTKLSLSSFKKLISFARHLSRLHHLLTRSLRLQVKANAPADGKVTTVDITKDFTISEKFDATKYWKEAGVENNVEFVVAGGAEFFAGYDAAAKGQYDIAFLDAHKADYDKYYEACIGSADKMGCIRQGGIIAVDNTLW